MAYGNNNEGPTTQQIPKFRFAVDFSPELKGDAFQEISGMGEEVQVPEYKGNNKTQFPPVKMPGIAKYGHITMKHGVFVNNNNFWALMNEIEMNTVLHRTVFIKLLDENGAMTMQWQLNNAWPTKITGIALKSGDNEITVDTLEIAHEQPIVTGGS